MEGLECSEAKLSDLERTKRVDAEFFNPHGMHAVKRLQEIGAVSLASIVGVSDGNHFSISDEFVDYGVPYFRGQDVTGSFFMEQACPVTIPHEVFDQKHMRRSHLAKGDVLLSIVGTIGESALYSSSQPATCSCKLAILRPHTIPSEYLAVFLKAKHGRLQIVRQTRGAIQGSLLLEDMDQILVPRFSRDFERSIVEMVRSAQANLEESAFCQAKAEHTLLQALGLKNWQPPEPLTYTRRASEVLASGRLDSEFHRPKCDSLRAVLQKQFQLKRLEDLGVIENGQTVPYNEEGMVPIIRSGDLSDIDDDSKFLRANESESIFKLERGDILISSIGFGSIGKVQVFDKPGSYSTVSEVTVIRQKQINPYFVASFLRSAYGQMQIERYITGATGQLHLYKRDVRKFFIPIIPAADQLKFEMFGKEAHAARQQAQALLAKAKRAVEVAIEEGEEKALRYFA